MSNEKWKMINSEALNGARLSFIGCGVMAEAIIAGLLSKNLVKPEQVVGSHPREERRAELQGKYGIRLLESNRKAVSDHSRQAVRVGTSTSGYAAPCVEDKDATA